MMNRSLIIFLVLCTFASAMVARPRRTVTTEEQKKTEAVKICAPETPCGWSIYKPYAKIFDFNIMNSYCICPDDSVCEVIDENSSTNSLVHKCRPLPVEEN